MTNTTELKRIVAQGKLDGSLVELYGAARLPAQRTRYLQAVEAFEALYGTQREVLLLSTPGRTEVCGNHTDHQRGRVLAASVDLDAIAVVSPAEAPVVRLASQGFTANHVELGDLSPREEERTHSNSLVRGIAQRFTELGYRIGGFDAYTTSDVLRGSGLSSSAAFEVLVGTIFNHLHNEGAIPPLELAKIGQFAENQYFGKPSGLMDQTACAVGGFVAIDFVQEQQPQVRQIPFDFAGCGYAVCIVDTGGSHADLTQAYADMPQEMRQVAAQFGKTVLSEVEPAQFFASVGQLRGKVSDRALLRAFHFYEENDRVLAAADALARGALEEFLQLEIASGRSSFMYLQNAFYTETPGEQGISLALALSERLLAGRGAWRVHGGGIAGTIQAFVPGELLPAYRQQLEAVFGEGRCHVVQVRAQGTMRLY